MSRFLEKMYYISTYDFPKLKIFKKKFSQQIMFCHLNKKLYRNKILAENIYQAEDKSPKQTTFNIIHDIGIMMI